METMGSRIQKLMKENDYSQKELASMIGVTESAMSRYINDEREPKSEVIANLATALNTTSDFLISGKPPKDDFAELYKLVARSTTTMTEQEKLKLVRLLVEK